MLYRYVRAHSLAHSHYLPCFVCSLSLPFPFPFICPLVLLRLTFLRLAGFLFRIGTDVLDGKSTRFASFFCSWASFLLPSFLVGGRRYKRRKPSPCAAQPSPIPCSLVSAWPWPFALCKPGLAGIPPVPPVHSFAHMKSNAHPSPQLPLAPNFSAHTPSGGCCSRPLLPFSQYRNATETEYESISLLLISSPLFSSQSPHVLLAYTRIPSPHISNPTLAFSRNPIVHTCSFHSKTSPSISRSNLSTLSRFTW